jgi:hypothetical protein
MFGSQMAKGATVICLVVISVLATVLVMRNNQAGENPRVANQRDKTPPTNSKTDRDAQTATPDKIRLLYLDYGNHQLIDQQLGETDEEFASRGAGPSMVEEAREQIKKAWPMSQDDYELQAVRTIKVEVEKHLAKEEEGLAYWSSEASNNPRLNTPLIARSTYQQTVNMDKARLAVIDARLKRLEKRRQE